MALGLTVVEKNASVDRLTALLNSGTVKLYTGTRPANADTALSGNTLLGTLTLNATAFAAASSGTATANAISDITTVAAGTATWARVATSGGTVKFDVNVGTSGSDINMSAVVLGSGDTVHVVSFTLTQP